MHCNKINHSLVMLGNCRSGTRPIKFDAEHNKRLREAYWKFAGIPRICYRICSDSIMTSHLQKIHSAIANIKSIEDFAEGRIDFDDEAGLLFKIEPVPI